jgi:hypothetical protein
MKDEDEYWQECLFLGIQAVYLNGLSCCSGFEMKIEECELELFENSDTNINKRIMINIALNECELCIDLVLAENEEL